MEPNETHIATNDGQFARVTLLDMPERTSRGAAVCDVDGDGWADVLIGNKDATPTLLMNRTLGGNNWVKIRVVQGDRVDALGSIIEAKLDDRTVSRSIHVDGSYLSSSAPTVLIGLGDKTELQEIHVKSLYGDEVQVDVIAAGETRTIHLEAQDRLPTILTD